MDEQWWMQIIVLVIPAMLAVIGWAFKKIFDLERRLTQTESRTEDVRFAHFEERLNQFEAWREDVANADEVREWGRLKKEFPTLQKRVHKLEERVIANEVRAEKEQAPPAAA